MIADRRALPRRLRTLTLIAAVAASVLIARPAMPERPHPAALDQAKKGASQMSTLNIAISLKSTAPVVSESFPVEVSLRNIGATPADVPDPDSPSVFEFAVKGLDSGLPSVTLSATRARLARDPNPAPKLGSDPVTLAAGAVRVYPHDLASFMAEPLPPGRYAVSVVYRGGRDVAQSADVPFLVSTPVVAAYTAASSPVSGALVSVLAHRGGDGRVAILQRDSRPGRPQDGVSYRRFELPPGETADGVAVTIETDPGDMEAGGRWYAYLQAGRLGAGMAEGATAFFRIEPADLGLKQAQLHRTGWQPRPGRAVFAAIGTDAAGKPSIALVTFLAKEKRAVVRTAPLGGASVPAKWAARYRADDGGTIDLVVADAVAGGTRVYRQSFIIESGRAAAPVGLIQRPEALSAIALAPLASGGKDAVDALFGPTGSPSRMTFVRVPMAGGTPMIDFPFAVPVDDKQQPPTDWALVPALPERPVGVAKFKGQIVGRPLSENARGFMLDPQGLGATRLQLHALGESTWAVWVDAVLGFQYRKLP